MKLPSDDNNGGCYEVLRGWPRSIGIGGRLQSYWVADLERNPQVERIVSIKETEDGFDDPVDFNPESLLEDAFGIVYDDPISLKIRFSSDQARYIQERRWAKKQRITKRKDGSIVLAMETSGWWDVEKWVLSFGADAEVLEPLEMRDEIKEHLQKALSLY